MKNDPVVFLCLTQEDPKTVKDFIEKKHFSLPIYTYQGKCPLVYETDGIPANFILSPQGKIVFKRVGSANWNDPACVDFLKKVIAAN